MTEMSCPVAMESFRYAEASAASTAERTISLGRLRSAANCVKAMRKSLFIVQPPPEGPALFTYPIEQRKWAQPTSDRTTMVIILSIAFILDSDNPPCAEAHLQTIICGDGKEGTSP